MKDGTSGLAGWDHHESEGASAMDAGHLEIGLLLISLAEDP